MNGSNQHIILTVTISLVVMAISSVLTICFLSYKGIQIPPELNTLAGGLVGAVTAMLVRTSPTSTEPQKSEIVNSKSNPIPTDPQT